MTETALQKMVRCVVETALERLGEEIDLTDLAREAGYSPFHFHRLFSGVLRETPGAFLRRLRLEKAAYDLLENKEVGVVAFDVDYGSPEAFTRAFTKAFGVTPSTFKDSGLSCRLPSANLIHYHMAVVIELRTNTNMDTRIETIEPLFCIGLKHHGPYYRIGETFGKLMPIVMQTGVKFDFTAASYYDDPERTPEDQLRSEALVVVPQGSGVPDGLITKTLDGGNYFIGRQVGSYSNLGAAWNDVFAELAKSNHSMRQAPCFELYRNVCGQVPDAELITDLYIPLL